MGRNRILSICYDPNTLYQLHTALKQEGCAVDSVLGNSGAMPLIPFTYDIVLIGHTAPLQERQQMLEWLRHHAPNARVVALRSGVACEDLPTVDAYADASSLDDCLRAIHAMREQTEVAT